MHLFAFCRVHAAEVSVLRTGQGTKVNPPKCHIMHAQMLRRIFLRFSYPVDFIKYR